MEIYAKNKNVLLAISCISLLCVPIAAFTEVEYIHALLEIQADIESNSTWEQAWQENVQNSNYQQEQTYTLSCSGVNKSPEKPTSVHRLRAGDIDVVAALGDSFSTGAGLGVETVFQMSHPQMRGNVWSIGGDGNIASSLTFPNILKYFNPKVYGYSTGMGKHDTSSSRLNLARFGASVSGLLGQTEGLIQKLKTDTKIDYANHWKLVTIMIGVKDICFFCQDTETNSPVNFERHVSASLNRLHEEVPRMLVNLVPVYDVGDLIAFNDNLVCEAFQRITCPCISETQDGKTMLRSIQLQYYDKLRGLVDYGVYDTRDDFTVVIQPFLANLKFPPVRNGVRDPTYTAPDCFHQSYKMHESMAYMLWNTMLTPVGFKSLRGNVVVPPNLLCPDEKHPYLFTNINSDETDMEFGPGDSVETNDRLWETIMVYGVISIAVALVMIITGGIFVTSCRKKKDAPQPRRPSVEFSSSRRPSLDWVEESALGGAADHAVRPSTPLLEPKLTSEHFAANYVSSSQGNGVAGMPPAGVPAGQQVNGTAPAATTGPVMRPKNKRHAVDPAHMDGRRRPSNGDNKIELAVDIHETKGKNDQTRPETNEVNIDRVQKPKWSDDKPMKIDIKDSHQPSTGPAERQSPVAVMPPGGGIRPRNPPPATQPPPPSPKKWGATSPPPSSAPIAIPPSGHEVPFAVVPPTFELPPPPPLEQAPPVVMNIPPSVENSPISNTRYMMRPPPGLPTQDLGSLEDNLGNAHTQTSV